MPDAFDRFMRNPYGKRTEDRPIQTWTGRVQDAPDIPPQEPFICEERSNEPPWPEVTGTARDESQSVSHDTIEQSQPIQEDLTHKTDSADPGQEYRGEVQAQRPIPQSQQHQHPIPPGQNQNGHFAEPIVVQNGSRSYPYAQRDKRPRRPYQGQYQQAQVVSPVQTLDRQPSYGQSSGYPQQSAPSQQPSAPAYGYGQPYLTQYQNPPVQQSESAQTDRRRIRLGFMKRKGPRTKSWKSYVKPAVVLVIVAIVAITMLDLNGWSPDPTDREMKVILTDSMDGEPTDYPISTIPIHSMVMIHHLGQDDLSGLKVGDVIAFTQLGIAEPFCHRIIEIHDTYFKTKGDNTQSGETVQFSQVVGEVVGVNHILGQIVYGIQHGNLQPFLIIAAIILLASSAIMWVLRWGKDVPP